MAVAGLRGTGDWGTDERPKNFRETILFLNPNGDSPLTALIAKAKSESVNDPEFNWWEETHSLVRLQVNGALLIGDTAFVVDNGLNGTTAQDLKPGDLLLVEKAGSAMGQSYTCEIVQVATVTSATAFTVTRGVAGTTAAAIADDAYLTQIGSAFGEGTDSADPNTRNPTKQNNYCQIFKDSYEITGTALQTHARTGDAKKNDRLRKMFAHSRSMEMAFLWGVPSETTAANGKPLRYTGGLLHFLSTNSRMKTYTSAVSDINTLFDDLEDIFDYTPDEPGASDERLILCGNGFLTKVNKLAKASSDVNFNGVVKTYGMKMVEMIIPQGRFFLKTHPLMNQSPEWRHNAFVVNGSGLRYRYVRGRDTKSEDITQTNGKDAEKGQWMGECGLEPHHMQTMKYLGNINQA